jgi:hypothetical protein
MAYITLQDVRDQGFTNPPYSDTVVNQAIADVEDYILQVTGNWFDVRTLTLELDGLQSEVLPLPHPIIEVTSIEMYGAPITLTDVSIYNRHLQGMLNPDDRQDPKIEFKSSYLYRLSDHAFYRTFPRDSKNIKIVGKFGYRDYDPLNPQGKVPPMLKRAALMLISRFIEQLGGPYGMAPWRGHELARKTTRNQSCEYASALTEGRLFGGITGDIYVDRILSLFVRPINVGIV